MIFMPSSTEAQTACSPCYADHFARKACLLSFPRATYVRRPHGANRTRRVTTNRERAVGGHEHSGTSTRNT
jgi:hypothetical protein